MTHSPEGGIAPGAQPPESLTQARIFDAGGRQASVVSIEHSEREALAWIRAGSGPQVLVPVSLLTLQPDGTYRLPFTFDESLDAGGNPRVTFPVVQEQLRIGKRVADTGRGVRIHKTVQVQEHTVDEPLLHDRIEVEHVPVDAIVSDSNPPHMRYEGDTLVVPVLEEVLVVQKQLRLKEEVRITRRKQEMHVPRSVSLRSEQVTVERFDDSTESGKGGLA